MAVVAELTYYPVKSCAGVSVPTAEVTATGLAHDRTFVVCRPDGVLITQRQVPRLAAVRPEVRHDGGKLVLAAPDTSDLVLDVITDAPLRPVQVQRWAGGAVDQGDEVAEWFSDVLGTPVRLMRAAPGMRRMSDGEITGPINFPDSTALVVISWSSLDGLNERIVEHGGEALPMNRFRPNVVVSGWPRPHTEDLVRAFALGEAECGFAKKDIRCVVTTIDQETGEKLGPEPLRTLATYRREPDGGVSFGMKASVLTTGAVSVGDELAVHRWHTP